MADREVAVIVRVAGADVRAGRLWCHRRRGTESQTFSYAGEYLGLPGAYELDPLLPLVEGSQQTPTGRAIFGAFSDAAPDRWGRRLISRAERRRVKREGGTPRGFGEADYLLGVRDDLRQGALRFREPDSSRSTTSSPKATGSRSAGRCGAPTPARCSAGRPAVGPSSWRRS